MRIAPGEYGWVQIRIQKTGPELWSPPMAAAPFLTSRRVEFRDTDAAGIMHFASIIALMEEAEHDFWRHLQIPLFKAVEGGKLSWPRVSTACDFKSPARFEDTLEISVAVDQLGTKSVTFRFELHVENRLVAEGTITAACCLVGSHGIRSVRIPEDIRAVLETYQISP